MHQYFLYFLLLFAVIKLAAQTDNLRPCDFSENHYELQALNDSMDCLERIVNFWDAYSFALKNKDMEYLLAHSMDSIECSYCLQHENPDEFKRWWAASFMLECCVENLYDVTLLEGKNVSHSFSLSGGLFYINYSIKDETFPEGGYNIVFNVQPTDKGLKFLGAFGIP